MSRAVRLTAELWHASGFAVIPARSDGSKAPDGGDWGGKNALMTTDEQLESWFSRDPDTYGLLTGNVSGGLEMFEFEGRAVAEGWLNDFDILVRDHDFIEQWARLGTYVERTPSGGLHYLYRVVDPTTGAPAAHHKNEKLANRPTTFEEKAADMAARRCEPKDVAKQLVMVETRASGGFTVTAPSTDASCNVNGRGPGWVRLEGSVPGEVPTITPAERDKLYALARMLDRMPVREVDLRERAARPILPWEGAGTGTPWDDFEARTDWADILEPHGWALVKTESNGTHYWRRPGKDVYGNGGAKGFQWSASTGRAGDRDRLYVWSSSTEFETEVPMTKGYVYAVLNHGGDRSEATRALGAAGFGQQRNSSWADALQTADSAASLRGIAAESASPSTSHIGTQEATDWTSNLPVHADKNSVADNIESLDPAVGPKGVYLSEEFWATRKVFGFLREAALHAMLSPEGVLIAALATLAANVGPNIVLPACIRTEASLNLMTVTVGSAGDGKSGCRKLVQKVLKFTPSDNIYRFNPGSGQGISGQYQRVVKEKGVEQRLEFIRFSAMMTADESDKVASLMNSNTSILSSELRQAVMGESIGAGNIGDTRTNLPDHSYRFVMAMCMQPELADWLMQQMAGGLPQRCLFSCVRRGHRRGHKDPGILTVVLPLEATPDPVSGAPRTWTPMGIDPEICAWIQEQEELRSWKVGAGVDEDPMEAHATLLRLKIAGLIALLDARLHINNEDWTLAEELVSTSMATVDWIQSILAEENGKKTERSRAVKVGDARAIKVAEVETADQVGQAKCARAIERRLSRKGADGDTKSDLRRGIDSALRAYLEPVLDALLQVGKVRFENIEKDGVQIGSKWWLT